MRDAAMKRFVRALLGLVLLACLALYVSNMLVR
jgi:hypothetical protein